MPRYKIIVNPTSGRGFALKMIPEIEENLKKLGLDYDLVQTERPWHAAELAEKAAMDGYDVVVSASGDGTANEVINGLMRAQDKGATRTAMGMITVGTGNDLAYGMNIPGDFNECFKVLGENIRKVMDIGLVKGGDYPEGRYFGNGVGMGFDAAVGFEAVKIRWTRGLLAYLIAALKTVFLYFTAPLVQISYDGTSIEQSSLMISVMNGQRMGGGFYMAPNGDPGDGWLDLCIAATASKMRIFQLITYFMKGTQATQPEVKTARARNVSITAIKGSLPAHCDGETLCLSGEKLEIVLLPQRLEFIISGQSR
jgi:diacylglycerol kinase (ATP)